MKPLIRADDPALGQIRKLTDVSRALTYAASLDEVFQLTVDRAVDLLAAKRSLLLVCDDDGVPVLRAARGVDGAEVERLHEPLTEALPPHLARLLGVKLESFLGVPLVVDGAIRGVLAVIREPPSAASEEDEWLLSALADQAALALEKSRLGELGEFRERLIGVVGHDLRNPQTTILMAARLLLQHEGLGATEAHLARQIARSASLSLRLIDQLLDLTRSRLGGGIPVDAKRCDIGDVCRQLIDETGLTHPDRPVRVDVRGDSTGVWDRDRMYQVLGNLVGNAVQHGAPHSPIEVLVGGSEAELVIEVSNRGEPIPAAELPFIFEAFRPGRATNRSSARGLGLGLFIAKEILRAHGGSIAVASSDGERTTLRVRLPRTRPA